MIDFFKYPRRKIGVVTLVMAMAFIGGWLRSQSRFDSVLLFAKYDRTKSMYSTTSHSLNSTRGSLVWERTRETANHPNYDVDLGVSHLRWRSTSEIYKFEDVPLTWRCQFCGFGFCVSRQEQGTWSKSSSFLFVPYWLIVVSLALLTIYLLKYKRLPSDLQHSEQLVSDKRRYFRSWRTRTGLVSLVLAMLVLGCVLRSDAFIDEWNFGSGKECRFSSITNTRFGIVWTVRWTQAKGQLLYPPGWHAISFSPAEFQLDRDPGNPFFKLPYPLYLTRRWDLCGLGSGEFHTGLDERDTLRQRMTFWIVPFGILLWPLTLVSLWLLMCRPRGAAQRKAAEPIVETV